MEKIKLEISENQIFTRNKNFFSAISKFKKKTPLHKKKIHFYYGTENSSFIL